MLKNPMRILIALVVFSAEELPLLFSNRSPLNIL